MSTREDAVLPTVTVEVPDAAAEDEGGGEEDGSPGGEANGSLPGSVVEGNADTFPGGAVVRVSGPSGGLRLPARYEDLGFIGRGGAGEVRRVRDRVLERVLAMKLLRPEHVYSPGWRARFLAEACITADLQHPGIVAVHDRGELEDGRLWFTMRQVRGRTLRGVIEEVHEASGPEGFREAASGWTFRRLVDAFARVCQAVAYAHSRGVVHRDLKPDNLMVGEFGEVLVMDWGLARRAPEAAPVEGASGPFLGEGEAGVVFTHHGDVLGTPAYMAPEQARGERDLHGPATDVYALGVILYELLAGHPPYEGSALAVWRQVLAGPPAPVGEAARGGPPLPAELVAIVERAMQREIGARYPDADALARAVVAFLDGARRREQALAALTLARAGRPEVVSLRERAARRRAEAQAQLAGARPFDPVERKLPGWQLEDEAARLNIEATLRETAWLQAVHGALSVDPELPEAHAALADHYRERLLEAEITRRDEDAARFEALLRAHDRGRYAALLRGEGALTLVTEPPGASVHLERYALRDRRLVPEALGALGQTPLFAAPLERGSYRLRLRAPGRAEVLYPVLIERGGHWDGRAPGEGAPSPIVLPREGELGPDDVYVPAGWCWTGGDPEAADSLPSRRVWVDAFVIRRFPVTNAEFLAFLNALVASGREAEAMAACPRSQLGMAEGASERLVFRRGDDGRFLPREDDLDQPFAEDLPVALVDFHGAVVYARWLSEQTGLSWRLPDEMEREKAARGADGRLCPWGDHLDATFACALDSHEGAPARVSVQRFPVDESPYGVRGLAGNTRDWCSNVWRRDGPLVVGGRLVLEAAAPEEGDFRAARGGAWSSPLELSRAAARFGGRPGIRRLTMGLRVVRSCG